MTLDQTALSEVLESLKTADVTDRVRQAADAIYQALIEAEPTAVIGAASEHSQDQPAQRNGGLLATASRASRRRCTPSRRASPGQHFASETA
jgi:putative transposase